MNVTIYFKNGSTAFFRDVEDFSTYMNRILFAYRGKTTKKRMIATFYKDDIAGFTRTQLGSDQNDNEEN